MNTMLKAMTEGFSDIVDDAPPPHKHVWEKVFWNESDFVNVAMCRCGAVERQLIDWNMPQVTICN